ncbi:hypothetical protein BRC63_02325 [Halobacteriales archaeon QH_10_70_21]|nr:MAG: hypothetical protein BRC63_02325 [Halobacteriales archaeon QH_10_70_21]
MSQRTRRSVLKLAGASAAAMAVPASGVATASEDGWRTAETPVDSTLHGVAHTAANSHAVGGGGTLIERRSGGWTTVLQGGPTGNGNDLYGVDVTDDGKRLWLVGASGAIGEYDVITGNLVDRSAPNDHTSNFNDVAVTGPAGDADVYVADDSGAVHYSFANGEEGTWEYEAPGSGSGLSAIDFYDDRSGHVIDTNGKVFATDDGVTYEAIGIEDADVTFYGLDSDGAGDVTVSGGTASVFTYDGSQWTPESLGDTDLVDIETTAGDGYAVGGGGVIFQLVSGEWVENDTPTGENLNGVATGAVDLAVGAGGLVLER